MPIISITNYTDSITNMLGVDNHFFKFILVSRIFLSGTPTPKLSVLTYYFANFFAKNCMKMKEFGP